MIEKKKRKNSKQKGNGFERDIVKKLNEMFNTTTFARTPSSGSYMGLSNWNRNSGLETGVKEMLSGDLIVPSEFLYSCELKCYEDAPSYSKIIKGSDANLDHWLGECLFDSKNMNKNPLLIFKTNNKGCFVSLPWHFIEEIGLNKFDNFLKYKEFFIISIEEFEKFKDIWIELSKKLLDKSIEWMNNSTYVEILISNILKK